MKSPMVFILEEHGGPNIGGFAVLVTPDRNFEMQFFVPNEQSQNDFKIAENIAAQFAFDEAEEHGHVVCWPDGRVLTRASYFGLDS